MLDANMQQQLGTYLTQFLRNPIVLTVSQNDGEKSQELTQLAEQIAALSDKVSVEFTSAPINGRSPVMAVGAAGQEARVFFAGVPLGHEFTSLVLALLQAGGHPSKEDEALQEQAKGLTAELNFEVYVSLSCNSCPDVVQAINLMAALNPKVTATMIDGGVFPEEVQAKNIMAVPTLYLNGEELGGGRMSLGEILSKVDTEGAAKVAESLSAKEPFDVLVVGGGTAGAAAALYAARKGIRTGVVADRFGGQVLDTLSIENFVSVKATEGPKLAAAMEEHVREYDVDIMNNQKAVALADKGEFKEVTLENGAVLRSKTVILATGARWRNMNVPGEQEYRTKGVAYCPHCDAPLFKGKDVAVIGGGNSGIEAAIDLAGITKSVKVFEFADSLRADEVLVKKAESLANLEIIKNAQTTEVVGDGTKVTGLSYVDRASGADNQVNLDGIFVQIGLVPNTEFLQDSVELSQRGEIQINDRCETSVPGVFAAGDATTVPYKQIIISMGQGATAALSAFDYLIRN